MEAIKQKLQKLKNEVQSYQEKEIEYKDEKKDLEEKISSVSSKHYFIMVIIFILL